MNPNNKQGAMKKTQALEETHWTDFTYANHAINFHVQFNFGQRQLYGYRK